MDALFQQVPERCMHQALALDTGLADEGRAFDFQAEVRFASGVVAPVSAMLLAVVAQRQDGRMERCFEAAPHFGCDGSLQNVFHRFI